MHSLTFPLSAKEAANWETKNITDINRNALFPQRLRDLRNDAKISQKELAEAIGVTKSTISLYENGDNVPDIKTFTKIADFYGVCYDYLLGKTDSQKREYIEASRQYGLTDKACECLEMLAASPNVILKVINALLEQHNDSIKEYQKENEPQYRLFKEWFYSASTGESVLSRIYSYLAILDSHSSFYVKLGEFGEEKIPISEVYYQGDAVPIDVKIIKDSRMADIKSALDSLSKPLGTSECLLGG